MKLLPCQNNTFVSKNGAFANILTLRLRIRDVSLSAWAASHPCTHTAVTGSYYYNTANFTYQLTSSGATRCSQLCASFACLPLNFKLNIFKISLSLLPLCNSNHTGLQGISCLSFCLLHFKTVCFI